MEDLEEQVEQLSDRVSYLERELEVSYMQNRFERRMFSLLPTDDHEVEISDGPYGYHARITDINGDDVQYIIDRLDSMDRYDYAVTETGAGLGMEVWTENFK